MECLEDFNQNAGSSLSSCSNYFDVGMARMYPRGKVYVNFHFILDENGEGNFGPEGDNNPNNPPGESIYHTGQKIAELILLDLERYITNIDKPNKDGVNGDVPSPQELPWKFELYTDPNNSADTYDGVWFWEDEHYDDYYNVIDALVGIGPYLSTIRDYGQYGDNVIDLYMIETLPTINSPTGWAPETTVVGDGIFLFGAWESWVTYEDDTTNLDGFWNLAQVLNHEIGHVFGLSHTNQSSQCSDIIVSNQIQQPKTNNVMNSVVHCCAFAPCQVNIMYQRFLTATNRPYFHPIDPCIFTSNPLTISTGANVIFNSQITLDRSILIEEDATLTIQCLLKMPVTGRIDLKPGGKLIVDGGKITSGCDGERWVGIKVSGGNSNFDVKFTGMATIEYTSEAAVSMFAPFPWPDIQQYGNGIIQADHTTFNNTKRIVEMMAWSPSFNPSYIQDCVQNGGKYGITNWNCYGVEITNNIFNDITDQSIVTETGQFLIEGNEFNSGKVDILFANVSPGFGTNIFDNKFDGYETGVTGVTNIKALGTTFGENKIVENQFLNGGMAIFMDGDNNYSVEHNDITTDFGIVSMNNGNYGNDVFLNDLNGNIIGLAPIGSNGAYVFFKNCFNSSFLDTYISGQISIVVSEGTDGAANNCFTHQGNINSQVFDIYGNPSPFKYVEPSDQNVNCLDAVKAPTSVTRMQLFDPENPCGIAGSGNIAPGPPSNLCSSYESASESLTAINSLLSQITAVQNNSNLSTFQKEWYTAMYQRCLKKVRWGLFEIYLKDEDYSAARNLLSTEGSDDAKIAIFTSYIYENNLTGASQYLAALPSGSEQLNDFKSIQLVNLQRIPYGPLYESNSTELSFIETIARKSHPYAGYGKALYFVLTGEIINSELPGVFDGYIAPRSSEYSRPNQTIEVVPNPFNDMLIIKVEGYKDLNINISDLFGRTIHRGIVNSENIVNTSTWNNGFYLVTLVSQNELIFQKKVILIH